MHRRTMITGLAMLPVAWASAPARAAGTTAIVVGYSAGGSTDIIARVLAPALSQKLGRTAIVEDRPGAAAQIASMYVERSAADGSVLQLATATSHAVAPTLYRHLAYNPVKDFTPIGRVAQAPLVLIVNNSVPVKSVAELIKYDKAQSHPIFACGGIGDGSDMAALLMDSMAHIKATAVAYQGDARALPAVVGGHVPYMFFLTPTATEALATGRVRALAVTTKARLAKFPNIPTMAESGFPGYEAVTWWGLFGPARMRPDLVERINKALNEVLAEPAVRHRLDPQGYQLTPSTPAEFKAFVAAENKKWATVIRKEGVAGTAG